MFWWATLFSTGVHSRPELLKWGLLYLFVGGVPTTPNPNTSAKISRYKWETYRDTNWWCIYIYIYIYMGEPPLFGRVWVTKTSILPVFGLKNGQKNSAWIRRNFWSGWLISIQKCHYFPCFSHIFVKKCLKQGKYTHFHKKWARVGKC